MKRIILREMKTKWRLSFGSGARDRKNVNILYNFVERKIDALLASPNCNKTAVRVIYGSGDHNESINSNNRSYLLYCLGCFLEDFLSVDIMNRIEKDYL